MKRLLCLLLVLVFALSLGVPAFADDVLYCRICGRQIPTDSKVCPYCGEKVIHVDGSAPAAQSASPATDVQSAFPVVSAGSSSAAQSLSTDTKQPATVAGPFGSTAGTSASGNVTVTKNPTSESVPYGGSCMFIAYAANATSVTWYVSSADGNTIMPAGDLPAYVNGLSVSGYNSSTLSLSGIPSWMNGCKVQACFTGEGGPVYSGIATIWTYQPAGSGSCDDGYADDWKWWDHLFDRFRPHHRCDPWEPWDPWGPCGFDDGESGSSSGRGGFSGFGGGSSGGFSDYGGGSSGGFSDYGGGSSGGFSDYDDGGSSGGFSDYDDGGSGSSSGGFSDYDGGSGGFSSFGSSSSGNSENIGETVP